MSRNRSISDRRLEMPQKISLKLQEYGSPYRTYVNNQRNEIADRQKIYSEHHQVPYNRFLNAIEQSNFQQTPSKLFRAVGSPRDIERSRVSSKDYDKYQTEYTEKINSDQKQVSRLQRKLIGQKFAKLTNTAIDTSTEEIGILSPREINDIYYTRGQQNFNQNQNYYQSSKTESNQEQLNEKINIENYQLKENQQQSEKQPIKRAKSPNTYVQPKLLSKIRSERDVLNEKEKVNNYVEKNRDCLCMKKNGHCLCRQNFENLRIRPELKNKFLNTSYAQSFHKKQQNTRSNLMNTNALHTQLKFNGPHFSKESIFQKDFVKFDIPSPKQKPPQKEFAPLVCERSSYARQYIDWATKGTEKIKWDQALKVTTHNQLALFNKTTSKNDFVDLKQTKSPKRAENRNWQISLKNQPVKLQNETTNISNNPYKYGMESPKRQLLQSTGQQLSHNYI